MKNDDDSHKQSCGGLSAKAWFVLTRTCRPRGTKKFDRRWPSPPWQLESQDLPPAVN